MNLELETYWSTHEEVAAMKAALLGGVIADVVVREKGDWNSRYDLLLVLADGRKLELSGTGCESEGVQAILK
jgi:hypothetical protein